MIWGQHKIICGVVRFVRWFHLFPLMWFEYFISVFRRVQKHVANAALTVVLRYSCGLKARREARFVSVTDGILNPGCKGGYLGVVGGLSSFLRMFGISVEGRVYWKLSPH